MSKTYLVFLKVIFFLLFKQEIYSSKWCFKKDFIYFLGPIFVGLK